MSFIHGPPVTRPERTVFDLVADDEDLLLVVDVLRDAAHADRDFDFGKLASLLESRYGEEKGHEVYHSLLVDSGLLNEKARA